MELQDPLGLEGKVVDGFLKIDRAHAQGGWSVVYKAHHLGLDQPVAVKCLFVRVQLSNELDDLVIARFRSEARLHYVLARGSLAIVQSLSLGTVATSRGDV